MDRPYEIAFDAVKAGREILLPRCKVSGVAVSKHPGFNRFLAELRAEFAEILLSMRTVGREKIARRFREAALRPATVSDRRGFGVWSRVDDETKVHWYDEGDSPRNFPVFGQRSISDRSVGPFLPVIPT